MTGYESKRAMAQDRVNYGASSNYPPQPAQEPLREALKLALEELAVRFSEGWHEGIKIDASDIMLLSDAAQALAQPAQEPKSVTYKEVADTMNALRKGTFEQRQIADEMENKRLYTSPPQRPWVGLTDEDCKNMSEGDRAFVMWVEAKLKEKNT
jgi:hypothetical protein